jgi:HSP90 family molecular chaperone
MKVSKSVEVITRSYKKDAPAYRWTSDGYVEISF